MDFKVTYLDAGLTNSNMHDSESVNQTNGQTSSAAKVPKRYKTHLRDFFSNCKGKRKNSAAAAAANTSPQAPVNDIYHETPALYASAVYSQGAAAAAVAAAGSYETTLYQAPYQIYSSVENRYFSSDYLASYRSLTSYYPEYHAAQYIGNSYFDTPPRPLYDASPALRSVEEKESECKYSSHAVPPAKEESLKKNASKDSSKSEVKSEPQSSTCEYTSKPDAPM